MEPPSSQPGEPAYREWWYAFDPRYSLRARAALLAGGAGMLFVLLTNWLAGNILRRSLESQLGPLYETLAFQVGDKIDRVIHERQHQLQFLAQAPAFRALPPGAAGAAQRKSWLETLQAASPDFAWLGLAEPSGTIVAGTQGLFEGQSVTTRPWFRAARENSYAGGPRDIPELPRGNSVADDETPGRFLDLAVPVTGPDGRPAGILAAHLRWAWAGEVARSVVNEAANRNQVGVTIYAGPTDVLLDSGASGWTVPPNAPAVANPRTFRGFFIEHFPLGTTYVTGFSRSRGFRDFRGLGWMIAVRQPIDRAFAPVRELQTLVARWGLGFTAALAIGAWLFAAPLVRRMKGIRAAAHRIRKGDILTVMPSHRGETEISEMCGALGQLVEDFRKKAPAATAAVPPSASGTPAAAGAPPPPPADRPARPSGSDPRRVVW